MRNHVIFLMIFALAFGVLSSTVTSAANGPIRGGNIRLAVPSDPPNYDAHTATTARVHIHSAAVFSGLVRTDPMKEAVTVENVIPDLAESWTISKDGKVYTFKLRKGVKFHDGKPFTAKDVKYSIDKYRDPKRSTFAAYVAPIDRVEIVDDYTIKMFLKQPYPEILLFLCQPYAAIQPEHLKDVDPRSTDFLVGTGPFKYKSHIPGKFTSTREIPTISSKGSRTQTITRSTSSASMP